MNKTSRAFVFACATLSAFADQIVPAGSAKWNSWTTPLANRSAGFWDGHSFDGAACNIGHWLSGTSSGCSLAGAGLFGVAPGALAYLSDAAENKTPIKFSVGPVGGSRAIRLRLKVTAYGSANEFGYYLLSSPGVLNPLFLGNHSAGDAANMQPTGPFAFYLKNGGNVTFTSQGSFNFAIFAQTPALPATPGTNLSHYWVGVEDLPRPVPPFTTPQVGATDADYQDLIVDMEIPPSDQPPGGNGCTLTQGGYKNNFNFKVVASAGVTLGTRKYTPAEVNTILGTPVRGNGLVSLAHQLIAAKLNIYYGAVAPQSVLSAITSADAMIGQMVVPAVGTDYLLPSATANLTSTLDAFNNGKLGPQHCR